MTDQIALKIDYYHPEPWQPFVEVELYGGYSFCKFCVWRQGDVLAWGSDSGCSCPTPFEDVELVMGNAADALADLKAWAADQDWRFDEDESGDVWRKVSARDDVKALAAAADRSASPAVRHIPPKPVEELPGDSWNDLCAAVREGMALVTPILADLIEELRDAEGNKALWALADRAEERLREVVGDE